MPRLCICVPACNEERHLPLLLESLSAQSGPHPIGVIVTLNNCTDASAEIVRDAASRYGATLDIRADIVRIDPPHNHAGTARARCMALGSQYLAASGGDPETDVLISTDADAVAPPGWVAANLAAIDAGADLVGGRLVTIPEPDGTPEQARRLAQSGQYWACVRALEDALDPVPADPPPRHGDHTGASLAVRRRVHDALGGIPPLRSGEDTAFVRLALAHEYTLRHPVDVSIGVSAREDGRAENGMAAHMKACRIASEAGAPARLPGAAQWRDRIAWRAAMRAQAGAAGVARLEPALPPLENDTPVEQAIAQLQAAASCAPALLCT